MTHPARCTHALMYGTEPRRVIPLRKPYGFTDTGEAMSRKNYPVSA